MNRYEMSVFLGCAELHGHHTGSTRRLSKVEVTETVQWLKERLATWAPSKPTAEKYDETVRALIVATLQEHHARK